MSNKETNLNKDLIDLNTCFSSSVFVSNIKFLELRNNFRLQYFKY